MESPCSQALRMEVIVKRQTIKMHKCMRFRNGSKESLRDKMFLAGKALNLDTTVQIYRCKMVYIVLEGGQGEADVSWACPIIPKA